MNKLRITMHGRQRLQERSSISNKKEMNKLFIMAMKKGKNPSDFKPPFYDFLHSKIRHGSQIKVYRGMIFIHKGGKLITAYQVPEKYAKQFDFHKLTKKYNVKINKLTNKDMYDLFIRCSEMLVSMVQINMSIGMQYDDDIFDILVRYYIQIQSCVKMMKTRTRVTSYKSRIKLTKDSIILKMRNFINEFEELAPGIVGLNVPNSINKTKSELHYDAERFTVLVENIERCSQYIYSNNFFLVSETVEESEGDSDGQENTEYNKEDNI